MDTNKDSNLFSYLRTKYGEDCVRLLIKWDSNHHLTAKQSVYNTLAHKAKAVSSTQEILDKELQHIKTALQACQFPKWALNQWQHKFLNNNQPNNNTRDNNSSNQESNHTNNTTKRNITLVVPYIKGISEKFTTLCKSKSIQVHFKGSNTLRTQLVNPKDKDPKTQKSDIIYHYKCPHINCREAYKGESGRALGERVKEHLKAPSPIFHNSSTTGHSLEPDDFNIIHKEVHSQSRTIKEAMFIHANDPTLKQKPGKISTSAYMGQHTTGITNATAQAFQPSHLPYPLSSP